MPIKFSSYDEFNESVEHFFRSAHAAIDRRDLQPLKKFIGRPNFPTQAEVDAVVKFLGIDPDYFFYNKKDILHPILYWKGPIYYGFLGRMSLATLKMMRADKYFEHIQKYAEEAKKRKDFRNLFHRIDKKILIPTFVDMYQEIPDDQKYDIFIDLYTRSEFGFEMLPRDLVRDCFSKRYLSKEWKERIEDFRNLVRNREKITAYRGEGKLSTADSYSWTLDKKTARFFADRFSGSGKIKSKEVKTEDVIDYLDNRKESEVLLDIGAMHESHEKVSHSARIDIFSPFHPTTIFLEDDYVKVFNGHESPWFTLRDGNIAIESKQPEYSVFNRMIEILSEKYKIYYSDRKKTSSEDQISDLLMEHPIFGKWWKDCLNKYRGKIASKKFGM